MSVVAPEIISESADSDRAEFVLRVPADLYYLQGHFPDEPVLPGVVQVNWAIEFGCSRFEMGREFQGIEVLKFHRIIKPDMTLNLTLEYVAASGKLFFEYTSDEGKHSQGRILFG